jgi:hypothetical protein
MNENGERDASGTAAGSKTVKRPKPAKPPYTRFKLMTNRRKTVEQNRRAVYAHLDEITKENIKLAKKGNAAIAKFLFEFAGIKAMAAVPEGSSRSKKASADPRKAVLSFYKKMGIDPPNLKPPKTVEGEEAEALPTTM